MYGFSQYDKMKYLSLNRLVIAFLLIFIGVASRIWLHGFLPPAPHIYVNLAGTKQPIFMPADVFFIIAAISLVAGRYLGNYYSFFVPFSIMLITDVFIGNNYIFLFTWSGFAILGCVGYLMQAGLLENLFYIAFHQYWHMIYGQILDGGLEDTMATACMDLYYVI